MCAAVILFLGRVSRRGLAFGSMSMCIVPGAVECGSLFCQRDSYAQSLSTKVLSAIPSHHGDEKYGAYAVQLQDTVLFPEGGGQVGIR